MISYLIGATDSAPSTSATNYHNPMPKDSNAWNTIENAASAVVPHPMALDRFQVTITTAPGVGKSYTFTLLVNGSPSGLACVISDSNTTAIDVVDVVSLNAGDTISIQSVPSGTPAATGAQYFNIRQSAPNLFGVLGRQVSLLGTQYGPVQAYSTASSTPESTFNSVIPTSGVLKNLYIFSAAAAGASQSTTVTLYKNGSATALTANITGASQTTSNDTAHAISVAAGDTISIEFIVSGASSATNMAFSMSFDPDIDGESFLTFNNRAGNPSTSATNYNQPLGDGYSTWSATESLRHLRVGGCTLRAFYIKTSAQPGAGKNYVFTFRDELADTPVAVTIADTNTTGSIKNQAIKIADNDRIDVSSVPTGTPAAVLAKMGILFYSPQPITFNNFQFVKAGDGISVSEKIR